MDGDLPGVRGEGRGRRLGDYFRLEDGSLGFAQVEGMLESFCNIHDLEPAAVFTMVQRACSSGLLDDEFLPSILQVAECGAGA